MSCTELMGWLYKTCPDNPVDTLYYRLFNYILPALVLLGLILITYLIIKKRRN